MEHFVETFAPPPSLKVLELGFGKGANAKFFHDRGDQFFGIDLPPPGLLVEFAGLGQFFTGDFSQELPPGWPFDLIFEKAAFVMNVDDALKRAVALAYDALKPGGLFISCDLFADGCPRLANSPKFRPFTRDEIRQLYARFETLHLELNTDSVAFDFVGRKPVS